MVYQMARTTEELDQVDQNELVSTSDSQTGFLPEAERFSLKSILSPKSMEPSKISGLIVNISTSLIGKSLPFPILCLGSCLLVLHGFLSLGMGVGVLLLVCAVIYSVLIVGDAYRHTVFLSISFGES